ncbi:unnamed protein product, partial [Cladocopium goreaui]
EAVERMKAKGPRPHVLALNLLAGVLSETSPRNARAVAQEALRLSQRLGDKDLEAQLWLRLSSIEAATLDRDDETLQALEKAMALWKQLPERSEAIACARYLSISVLLRMFDPKDSLKEASQVRAFFSEEKDAQREALSLVAVASVSFARNDVEDAKESLELARELFREVSDHRGEMLALTTLAEMSRSMGEISEEDALQCAMEALAEFRRRDNLRGQALVLSLLARTYVQIPDPETAVYVVRDALALFRELGDRKSEHALIRSIINNDLIPSSIEGSDVALKAAKVALAVCHQSEDKRGQAVMLKSTFRILLAREKPERALQAAEEALKMYRELEDQEGEAEMTMEAAKVLLQREEHRRALGAANCAAALYREVGDPRELFALQLAVDVHAARGDHAMVLETSQEVLEKCRSQQDPACEAALLQQICQVYLEQGGKENAEVVARTAKQAHVLAREAGDQHRETCALAALARAHLAASRNQEAVEVAKEAVRCAHESGDRPSQIVALQAFGDVSVKLGHPFDAIEAAKEAMDYARFEGLVVQEAAALGTLVDARLANAEPSEALRAAKEAHDRAKRLGNLRAEAAALSAVAKVCLHIKAPAEAIQALDGAQANYKKLKDRKKEAAVVHLAVKAQLLQGDAVNALRAAKEARGLARELRDRKAEAEA